MSMENLLTEIEVMKGLNHKHIVQLLDFEVSLLCSMLTMYMYVIYVITCKRLDRIITVCYTYHFGSQLLCL